MTRPPNLVIPDLPPPSSPASLLRHPRPRSGTYARVILAPDPKPIIPPSFRPPSRYPGDGRGNHHNRHPPPTPPYRRVGVGRYPGDGRGYPDKHPKNQTAHTHSTVVPGSNLTPPRTTHQHPPTIPPSFWPPTVFPVRGVEPHANLVIPDPSFRLSGPRSGTQGGAATPKPTSLRHSPPAQFVIPSAAEESKPFIHCPHHLQPTNTIIPNRPTL